MFGDLDLSLVKLLELEIGSPLPFDVSFAIPDKDFKPVSNQRNTLNCYLYDIRENRELRDMVRHLERLPGGVYSLDNPPCRIKASYCITAWSPAAVTPGVDPHLDEHNLLAAVLRILLLYPEFPRSAMLGTLTAQQLPLPTLVAQPDSARNSGDFWNAIGGQLRPSLEYGVTLWLDYQLDDKGPLATSVRVSYGLREPGSERLVEPAEALHIVRGIVWSKGPTMLPLTNVWVRVDETGELAVTDSNGEFAVHSVPPGSYTLRVRAPGYKEASQALTVPLTAGSFDVFLDPL